MNLVVFLLGLLVFTLGMIGLLVFYAEAPKDTAEEEHLRLPRWAERIFELLGLESAGGPPQGAEQPPKT